MPPGPVFHVTARHLESCSTPRDRRDPLDFRHAVLPHRHMNGGWGKRFANSPLPSGLSRKRRPSVTDRDDDSALATPQREDSPRSGPSRIRRFFLSFDCNYQVMPAAGIRPTSPVPPCVQSDNPCHKPSPSRAALPELRGKANSIHSAADDNQPESAHAPHHRGLGGTSEGPLPFVVRTQTATVEVAI